MHRLIVMSAAYRQSAAFNERAAAMDSENTLHWRYAPRRLEGEAIRDAMLMVSGQINLKHGGPGFRPFTVSSHGSDFYELKDMIGPEFNRRTIYRINVNSGKSPLMDALDCPDPSVKTPRRRTTTTPLQALGLMNNSFVQRQAALMAERMNTLAAGDGARAVEQAYLHALGRAPSEQEKKDSMELATREGLATLCWVLMNATEFVYVR